MTVSKLPVAVVSLGKNGDIISALGVVRHLSLAYGQIPFLFNAMFLHLFLGVSYVKAIPLRVSPQRVDEALRQAREKYVRVINLHNFGPNYHGPYDQPHNIRGWLAAGLTVENFHDLENFPLIFDRRDQEREARLCRKHIKTTKPLLMIALACSRSSPFPAHHLMIESLKRQWGNRFELVDLCRINAPRLYDMIGLLERAAMLITSDGSFLHLSAAVPTLKLIYLVGDNPLTAAVARQTPALTVRYSEWHKRIGEIHRVIQGERKTKFGSAVVKHLPRSRTPSLALTN